jgi:hypothetical protein
MLSNPVVNVNGNHRFAAQFSTNLILVFQATDSLRLRVVQDTSIELSAHLKIRISKPRGEL